jgi:uncharacterized protein YfaS (alpha-2-macroglobulin family)
MNARMQPSQSAHELLKGASERIEKRRKADATIRLLDSRGRPVRNRQVQVEFVQHAFLFGANIFPLYDFRRRPARDLRATVPRRAELRDAGLLLGRV